MPEPMIPTVPSPPAKYRIRPTIAIPAGISRRRFAARRQSGCGSGSGIRRTLGDRGVTALRRALGVQPRVLDSDGRTARDVGPEGEVVLVEGAHALGAD